MFSEPGLETPENVKVNCCDTPEPEAGLTLKEGGGGGAADPPPTFSAPTSTGALIPPQSESATLVPAPISVLDAARWKSKWASSKNCGTTSRPLLCAHTGP